MLMQAAVLFLVCLLVLSGCTKKDESKNENQKKCSTAYTKRRNK